MREGEPGYDDPFRPPDIPTEVHCLHCDEEYESYLIRWVPSTSGDPYDGFWCCPTPDCDGKGFCFDIWPTDPEWRDENGEKVWTSDGGDDEEDDEEEFDDEADEEELEWTPEWENAAYGDDPETSDDPPPPPDGRQPPEPPFNEDDIPY